MSGAMPVSSRGKSSIPYGLVCPGVLIVLAWLPWFACAQSSSPSPPPSQAQAASDAAEFRPVSGQEGKDVVWVPTPPALVETMLDLAGVTARDVVMDLGSGDGRNIIAAARRGARALGVEFNPKMVELARRNAERAGVAEKARFVQGDMFEADISEASVLALFLLTHNLDRLMPKFLALKPGTRIVVNTFGMSGWEADAADRTPGDCGVWCTAQLYIVPARVEGTWRLPQGDLVMTQKFQVLAGELRTAEGSRPISAARMQGDRIRFTAGGMTYQGRVEGDSMIAERPGPNGGLWRAARVSAGGAAGAVSPAAAFR